MSRLDGEWLVLDETARMRIAKNRWKIVLLRLVFRKRKFVQIRGCVYVLRFP